MIFLSLFLGCKEQELDLIEVNLKEDDSIDFSDNSFSYVETEWYDDYFGALMSGKRC